MALHIPSVKNLLIDLGGVLYEIDVQKTLQRYYNLLPPSLKSSNPLDLVKNPLFKKLDMGLIEIDAFAEGLIQEWKLETDPETIKQIWVELLVGLYPDRVRLVQALSEKYNIALLSNTSRYHYEHYIDECKPMFDAMDQLFFSFDYQIIKPEAKAYQTVLDRMGWKAGETLFMDDSQTNINGAEGQQLQTKWIEKPEDFEEIAHALLKTASV